MARRVNSKFVVFLVAISGAVVLAAVIGFYIHAKARNGEDYKQLEAKADEAERKGDLDSLEHAGNLLMSARDQVPDNTEILVKLGNVLNRLTGKDPMRLGQARIQWNKAVSVDPHCLEALRALLKSYSDELDLNPRPEVFVELKRICDRVLNVAPNDLPAQEKKQVAIIHEWLANQTASNDEVRASIETYLPELIAKDPENPELPRTLALARIEEAREMLNTNQNENARFVLNEATKMLDAARKGRDDNASMQYRACQSYIKIKQLYPDIRNNKDKEKEYNDRINDSIDLALKAASSMDPAKDTLCDEIYQAASEWKNQQGKPEDAEKIMRDFYEKHRDDQRARLTIARILELKADANHDPGARVEAVAILSNEAAKAPDMDGFRALVQRDLAAQTTSELIRIYLADYGTTPENDKSKRDEIAGKIDVQMDKLRHLYPPQSVPVLNLEGRFHLLKGENVEAVKTFEAAVLQMPPNNMDNDLLYQLAIAYTKTGQPGRARQKLEQVILKLDTAVPPRVLLTRLLLQFKELQAAAVQVRKLKDLAPDSPEVKQLADTLAITDPTNPTEAYKVFEQLGEGTREERQKKAQVAIALGRNDEAVRILEVFRKEAPEDARQLAQLPPTASDDDKKKANEKVAQDTQASLTLAKIYAANLGQKQSAKRVIEDCLKLHPDDPTLVDQDDRLRDMLPEDIYNDVSKAVQKTTDPFLKEVQMFDLESQEAQRLFNLRQDPSLHAQLAFGHLREAYKLKPDDAGVLDLMFRHYVEAGQSELADADRAAAADDAAGAQAARDRAKASFDQAVPLAARLAAQNADQCGGLMYQYRLSMARGDLATAEDQGRQLTQNYKEFAASWLVMAQVLQLRGKFDEAATFYLEVLNRQPGQYDAYLGLIECYSRLNQPENAEIRLREARVHYPNDPRLRELLLDYLVNYGKAAQAIPDREAILADNKQRQKDVADDYLQLAKAYFHAAQDEAFTKPTDAAKHLDTAFQTLAQGKEKFPDEGRFVSQLAEMYQYNRDLVAGEKVLKDWHDLPRLMDDPNPALLLADFYLRAGKAEKSELYLNEAMVKAEKREGGPDTTLRLRMASLQAQERKFDAAYNTLNVFGSQGKTDERVVRQRLEIMIAQGRREEARKGLEAELAKRDVAELHLLHISLLIDARELDAALKEAEHVLALDPKNDAAIYLQSLALDRTGDIPRAVNQLLEVRNRDPRNSQVRLLLAELYNKSGKTDYAIRELEDALQKLPLDRNMRIALIQLYRGERPLTNDVLNNVVKLCMYAEADPVLGTDITWPRERALAYAAMDPPPVPLAVVAWQKVISLAPDKADFRREFVDLLIQFRDWNAVMNETDKLAKMGHDEWWLHYQRGVAVAHLDQKDKALAEFDYALKLTDAKAAPTQGEFIIRGIGDNVGYQLGLDRVAPLLGNDPDGTWRLLQASLLRADGKFQQAEEIVNLMLADPLNKPAARRVPLLRAKADICQAYANARSKDTPLAIAENIKARDAYVELLGFVPDDMISLNNVAYLLSERIPPPQGGPLKAREYSSKAFDLVRFDPVPNILVIDTQGWVLTLCGGDDAVEGLRILKDMIDRKDTKTFIEGRYHLAEAYLRSVKPDSAAAQKWLKEAMDLIASDEQAGRKVDQALKDKIQTSLAKLTGPVTSGR